MGITAGRREVPAPTAGQLASAAVDAWMTWALVAVGAVLLYVSLYVVDDGPFDDLLFGLLTVTAVVVSLQRTYSGARARAREGATTAADLE